MTNVSKLPELLARIAEIFERSGAKRQADGVRALRDVLVEEIACSGEATIGVVRARLAAHRQPKKGATSRSTLSIDEYVARLESLQGDASLRELIQEFEAKTFRKADLDRIAHRFAKGAQKYKSKFEAIKEIERRFLQRTRSAKELEYLERKKVTPW